MTTQTSILKKMLEKKRIYLPSLACLAVIEASDLHARLGEFGPCVADLVSAALALASLATDCCAAYIGRGYDGTALATSFVANNSNHIVELISGAGALIALTVITVQVAFGTLHHGRAVYVEVRGALIHV